MYLQDNQYQPQQREQLGHSLQEMKSNQQRLQQEYFNSKVPRSADQEIQGRYNTEYNNQYSPQQGSIDYEVKFNTVAKRTLEGNIPFRGITSYQEHYQQHPNQAKNLNPELYKLIVPELQLPAYPRHQIKFEGETSYNAAYKNNEIMDSIRLLNSEKIDRKKYWTQSKVPFYGNSSYKSQFQPFRFEVRQNHNPFPLQEPRKIEFAGKSVYKDNFQGYKVEVPRRCDVNYLPVPYKNFGPNNHIYYDSVRNTFV